MITVSKKTEIAGLLVDQTVFATQDGDALHVKIVTFDTDRTSECEITLRGDSATRFLAQLTA